MNISNASAADIPKLVILINSAYRGESSKKGWTTEANLLDGIRVDNTTLEQLIGKKDAVILKFCNENKVIEGCVYLEQKNNKMYVGMLTVSPMLQAKGLGKKLLYAAEKYAHEHNCFIMQMTVISLREELIKWYERHGYYKTGDIQSFPDDEKFGIQKQPLQLLVMEKEI